MKNSGKKGISSGGKPRNDDFDYVPREEKEINWSKYDDAQINEINDMLLLIRDTVDEAARRLDLDIEKSEGRGRPPLPASDLAKTPCPFRLPIERN